MRTVVAILSLSVLALSGLLGCGRKPPEQSSSLTATTAVKTGSSVQTATSTSSFPKRTVDPQTAAALAALDAARKKEEELNGRLQQASGMMKAGDLEGALRLVTRLQQENARDPYAGMQVSYLRAMIHHRMKDPVRRKEAMNDLLKNMEAVQKDPRFVASFKEGMDAQAVIKMSLEKAGKRYGLP